MNAHHPQQRINELQQLRHRLLSRREQRGAAISSIDMELNVVRSELQALYALQRDQKPANQRSLVTHGLKMA
jgi:septation ring formation regulator EzrA